MHANITEQRLTGWWRGLRRRFGGTMAFSTGAVSLQGRRPENQDNYLLLQPLAESALAQMLVDGTVHESAIADWPARRVKLALFDGMGGHRGGREIAEAAVKAVAESPAQHDPAGLRQTIQQIHALLGQRFPGIDRDSPGTTLVWVELDLDSGCGLLAHVGDSRAYRLAQEQWSALTHDHTIAEFNWRDGELDDQRYQEARRMGSQRLAQAMGYGSWGVLADARGVKPFRRCTRLRLDLPKELPPAIQHHADVQALQLQPGEVLLLASDGLWDQQPGGRWQGPTCLPATTDAAKRIADTALQAGSMDNITVVLAGFAEEQKRA